ncbi:MAG: cation:proton antiporter, partial [Polaromonas sp.]
LLFQDVAAIPILALLPLLGALYGSNDAVAQPQRALEAIKIIVVIAGIILGGRLLLRPLLRWIANSRTPEIFTAASLLLVVGIAGLMQLVGLSMALGAFLAGVLLAESEYRRELETDIEPFKALLLGLFFIAVGMSIDFGVLFKFPGQMLAILAGFLGLKLLAIYGLAYVMKLPYQERPVFALLLAQGGEFAFVVFQAAAGAEVFSLQTASLLIGAVALSMLISPLLLVAIDKLLLPRYANGKKSALPEISEPQEAPIIIAGFGRYGQIVGRMLLAQGISATVLDHDAEMIETLRAFGYRVFYGDATRLDLLRTAGAASAKILVLSVDDVEQSLKIVDVVRQNFPQLEIIARARDVPHWNALRDRGVMRVERELFESSLRSARTVLELLGQTPQAAQLAAERFRAHNLELFEQMYPHRNNREKVIAVARQGRLQLEAQMKQEREQAAQQRRDA